MAVTNIQTGRQRSIEVQNVKALQLQINEIMDAAAGKEVAAITADAGRYVLSMLKSRATSVHVPHQVLQDLFINTRQQPTALSGSGNRPDSVTVLVGLRKKGTKTPAQAYREWNASRQVGAFDKTQRVRSRGKKLVFGGGRIGENLGTMWELGTTKMAAKPWFRPVISAARDGVYSIMTAGFEALLAKRTQ